MIFVFFSVYLDDIFGQFYSIFVLNVAAAEIALGLAILIIYFRYKGTISINQLSLLKG
jgi:NADH-quinone oxidoreductase subunit K